MFTAPEKTDASSDWIAFVRDASRILPGLMGLVVLSMIMSCAGSGTTGNGNGGQSVEADSSSEVPEEELDKLLEQQQKRRLKPSDNSPGPVMVSFFAKRGSSSDGVLKKDTGNGFPNREGAPRERKKKDQSKYQYMILLSKEWAYENRPIREAFLDVARPDVKIMRDWRMNRFIKFLNENRFSDFPSAGSVSQEQIEHMAPGEKMITYWEGDQYRRVYFRDQMARGLRNQSAWNNTSSEEFQKVKNRLIIGYLRAFNAAGLSQMQVNIGPTPSRKRLDQLAEQASPDKQEDVQRELYRAKTLHENGQHRRARTVLMNVMEETRGTTFRADAQALLQSIQHALQNE